MYVILWAFASSEDGFMCFRWDGKGREGRERGGKRERKDEERTLAQILPASLMKPVCIADDSLLATVCFCKPAKWESLFLSTIRESGGSKPRDRKSVV